MPGSGPNYNADRELGQGEKVWVVQNAQHPVVKEIQTGRGPLKLDDKGRCIVKDRALADEIRRSHPRDLVVSRIFREHPSERGHRHFFAGWPEMPWKRNKRLEAAITAQAEALEEAEQEADKEEQDER